jgi:hypothetical protein
MNNITNLKERKRKAHNLAVSVYCYFFAMLASRSPSEHTTSFTNPPAPAGSTLVSTVAQRLPSARRGVFI